MGTGNYVHMRAQLSHRGSQTIHLSGAFGVPHGPKDRLISRPQLNGIDLAERSFKGETDVTLTKVLFVNTREMRETNQLIQQCFPGLNTAARNLIVSGIIALGLTFEGLSPFPSNRANATEASSAQAILSTKTSHRLGQNLLQSSDGDVVSYDSAQDNATRFFSETVFRDRHGRMGVSEEIDAVHSISRTSVVFSTKGRGRIGNPIVDFKMGDLVQYDIQTDTAQIIFSQDNFRKRNGSRGAMGNIDAVHVREDGKIYLSTSRPESLGAYPNTLHFEKGDLVLYDPQTDTATLILDRSIYRTLRGDAGALADIDAVYVIDQATFIISTFAVDFVGANSLRVRDGDLVLYDAQTDTASLYFSESQFRSRTGRLGGTADIDAVSIIGEDCPECTQDAELTVTKIGTGVGTVISGPSGINCGSDCSEWYPTGTQVTLIAMPVAGSAFVGWSGPCSGTGTCVVDMSLTQTVEAQFGLLRSLTINVLVPDRGEVRETGVVGGWSCTNCCTKMYPDGATVSLSAFPIPGAYFMGWDKACNGHGNCSLIMDGDKVVDAHFE